MTGTVHLPGMLIYLVWIRALSVLVPRAARAEWRRHWASEIWYVYRDAVPNNPRDHHYGRAYWQGHRGVAVFCLGAWDDLRSLKENAHSKPLTRVPYARSATQCLGILTVLVALSAGCFLLLPGEIATFERSPFQSPRSVVLITRDADADAHRPGITVAQYNAWRNRSQQLFSEFALYQLGRRKVQVEGNQAPDLSVASVTPNLFKLLGASMPSLQDASGDRVPLLLISEGALRSNFGGDTTVVGRIVRVGDRQARVAGVVDESIWQLPGRADAWLIEPDEAASALAPTSMAYVLARKSADASADSLGESWHMTVADRPGEVAFAPGGYACFSVKSITSRPLAIFIVTVILALLALPATTSLPLGEYRVNAPQRSLRSRMRRWGFLYSKFALTLPLVFFVSRDLAHLPGLSSLSAEYVQIIASFCICLYGLRWSLRDQRARCPVCLCKLSHPARVGEASRNFLAWNGTELICADGHGLLHVPELPTCWFSTQRWVYLDSSWSGLFAKPT